MLELIDRIRAKKAEQAYLFDVLALWQVAKQAGYEADEVKAFSFRPEFLTPDHKKQNRRDHRPTIGGDKYHNCVRLHTGELKPIPLTERPHEPS